MLIIITNHAISNNSMEPQKGFAWYSVGNISKHK